ncbi:MAG TPA: phospholipase [Solirubrobacterales bacterium]|nr:phospholipase [Solirubrobacterales bacterium]
MTTARFGDVDLLLREPAEPEPAGALILNHGRGADEHDLFPLLEALDPERRLLGITTGAPIQGMAPGGRHWYIVERIGFPHEETFHASYAALAELLDRTLAERGIDWDRTVLGGFSQGAVMSYAIGLGEGRPTPAGLLAISGFIPEVERFEIEVEEREGLAVQIHHGAADPVIEAGFGRRAAEELRASGLQVEHLETDVGHAIAPESVAAARGFVANRIPTGVSG